MTAIALQHAPLGFTAEQLERRRQTLGASEIATALGYNPYKSPIQLFLEKRGEVLVDVSDMSEPAEWGHRLEQSIARKYGEVHAVAFDLVGSLVHPDEPWMSATPDFLAVYGDGSRVDLQVKCRNMFAASEFGEPGTDAIPMDIVAQVQWELRVLHANGYHDVQRADVAVLFGGNRYAEYSVFYDTEIADALQNLGSEFWFNRVQKNVMPDIDATEATARALAKRFPKHSVEIRQATREEDQLLADLGRMRVARKDIEEAESLLENKLKAAIGEAAGIEGPSGRAMWKAPEKGQVSWKSVAEALGAPKHPELIEQHTGKPSRRFNYYAAKER